MSKPKFSGKDLISQLKTCPELAYDFTPEQVLEEINRFFPFIGYKMEDLTGLDEKGKPEFWVKREDSGKTFEIAGVVSQDMTKAGDGVILLDSIKERLGDSLEYVVVVPPVNEYHLIQFLCNDDNKWYKKLQEGGYMIWLCNPSEKAIWCPFGAPKDKKILEFLKYKEMTNTYFNLPKHNEDLQTRHGTWKGEIDL